MTMPKFGFWTLTCLVVANMIGAGLFTTSGYTLQTLGSPTLVVWAWGIAGIIALAGAYSYGELCRHLPESGGEYLFLARVAHPLLGFIAGWVSLIAGFSGAIAVAALALEAYLKSYFPDRLLPPWHPIAVVSIVLAGMLHGWAPRRGAHLQNGIVLLKLTMLGLFFALAVWSRTNRSWAGGQIDVPVRTTLEFGAAFAESLVWISLSYMGFNAAVYVASESHNAAVVVPRALLVGTLLVAIIYVSFNSVIVFAPPSTRIVGQAEVAAIAADYLGGPHFATFVRALITLALFTSVLSMMMAAPRVYAKMADDRLLPAWFRFQDDRPLAPVAIQVALACLIVSVTSLQDLLKYLGLTLSLSAASSVACLLAPSLRDRPVWHPRYWPPMLYILGTLVSAILMAYRDSRQLFAAITTFAIGAILFRLQNKARMRFTN